MVNSRLDRILNSVSYRLDVVFLVVVEDIVHVRRIQVGEWGMLRIPGFPIVGI